MSTLENGVLRYKVSKSIIKEILIGKRLTINVTRETIEYFINNDRMQELLSITELVILCSQENIKIQVKTKVKSILSLGSTGYIFNDAISNLKDISDLNIMFQEVEVISSNRQQIQ